MADEQQRQALSAFSLLVDAANAQQTTRSTAVGRGPKGGASETRDATTSAGSIINGSITGTFGVGAGFEMTLEDRAAAIRQALASAAPSKLTHNSSPAQNQASEAITNSDYEGIDIQEAINRELLHREALRRQQAAALMGFQGNLMQGLSGAGGGFGGNSLAVAQEAEYLQQLRLEALVQQRRQETLAQLALAQELGIQAPDVQAILEAEQSRQALLIRQEAMLANYASISGAYGGVGPTGGLDGILGALQNAGVGGGINEEGILQMLQERERQRTLALLAQAQQHQQQQAVPQALGSAGLMASQGHGRADLIRSVFSKGQKAPDVDMTEGAKLQLLKQQYSTASVPEMPSCSSSTLEHHQSPHVAAVLAQEGSKTTILPCRARGMPIDHNVKTAYFVVPEGVKHGTELVCSYFACRNAGIKFRYCVYCKLPVAKRNFAKRHRHVGKIPASDLPGDFDDSLEEDDLSNSEQGYAGMKLSAKVKTDMSKTNVAGSVAEAAASVSEPCNSGQWSAKELLDLLIARNVQELQSENSGARNLPITAEILGTLLQKKQGDWDKLLLDRPRSTNDPSAMASWLLEVLRVSDVDKETTPGVAAAPIKASARLKKPSLKAKKRKLIQRAVTNPNKIKIETINNVEMAATMTLETNGETVKKPTAPGARKAKIKPPNKATEKEVETESEVGEEKENFEEESSVVMEDDDASTSSEDSVDLRASKKARS